MRVYPRVCGGTNSDDFTASQWKGLSPRVRGNRSGGSTRDSRTGSIPACAGEPCYGTDETAKAMVYPRVCGGTPNSRRYTTTPVGLSPRVRGNRVAPAAADELRGSIPACAGEPISLRPKTSNTKVYPRVCGGTSAALRPYASERGLSPRVRGNPHHGQGQTVNVRSIPACAGEPQNRPPRLRGAPVYPRVCGGTVAGRSTAQLWMGLSPRVRGNPAHQNLHAGAERSIPACAGEPSRSSWSEAR